MSQFRLDNARYRNYFLTVNEGAQCFPAFAHYVDQSGREWGAWILHDKDEGTSPHIHAVLTFPNGKTSRTIAKAFPGAHVEPCRSIRNAVAYLLHKTPSSMEDGKHEYEASEIVSTDPESLNAILTAPEARHEPFSDASIVCYIAQQTVTPYRFLQRFGIEAYKAYWRAYKEILDSQHWDEELAYAIECAQQALGEETSTE